jgi:hypothetical protein
VGELGRGPADQREGRKVGVDPDARRVGLGAGHLDGAGEHRREVERIVGTVASPAGEILQPRHDPCGVGHYAGQHVERAAGPVELGVGAKGGDPQADEVQRVVQIVRHPGSEDAHGVHPLLVQQGLALSLELPLPAQLGAHVVHEGDGFPALQPLQPHLDHLVATLVARQVGHRREGRCLATEQLGQVCVPHPGVRTVHPAPGAAPRLEGGESGVSLSHGSRFDHRQRGRAGGISPAREEVARFERGH